MSDQNPYTSPSVNAPNDSLNEEFRIRLNAPDHAKAEAIIKEARQFWLAIVLCIFCSAIGSIVIPIWYTVRLSQWSKLAKKYPELMAADVPKKSMQRKFQSSQWKLITGLVFGCIMLACVIIYCLAIALDVAG